jgi:hypothetical protein
VNRTTMFVESGRIHVVPSFADLFRVQRLGGRFRNGTWHFPGTPASARFLRKNLPSADVTPDFMVLLAPEPAPQPEPRPAFLPVRKAPPPAPPAEPEIVLPNGLITSPWRHQRAAFRFATEKFKAGFHGVLLACGMGTGKSLIACMLTLSTGAQRVLIVAPLRVVQVWVTQFERHVSKKVLLVTLDEEVGSVADKQKYAAQKLKLAQTLGIPFICIINYDSGWREPFASWAEGIGGWDLVILDEAHRIKAPGGKASLFCKRLRKYAIYRVALTGTPMPHGPMDIYAIFRFLDINIFGSSFSAHRTKFAVMGGYQRKQITGYQNLDTLEALMSRITFRVGADVLDLPPATHVTYYCDLTPEAARVYRDEDQDLVARVNDGTVTATNVLVKLLRLQQITGGCVPTDDGVVHRVDSSKQKLLADTVAKEPGDAKVRCVMAMKRVYGFDNGASLARTLDTLIAAWGRTEAAMDGKIVEGMGMVFKTYGDVIDHPALIKKLGKYAGGAAAVLGDARALKSHRSGPIARCVAEVMIDVYNSGRRSGKLDLL